MIHEIQNEHIIVKVNDFGAELMSVFGKKSQTEYLWDGKEEHWARRSPILFPFVGLLNHKEYRYDGQTYPMTSHGFARDMDFTLKSKTEDEIWHVLSSNGDTIRVYPFSFELEIGYKLIEQSVQVMWRVTNTNQKDMHFSIGAHPAFLCPIHDDSIQNEYYVGFHNAENLTLSLIDIETGLLKDEKKELTLSPHTLLDKTTIGLIQVTDELFAQDALVAENHQVQKISLLTPDKIPYVTVEFDAPLFGVWSKYTDGKNAPFICIEPWYGRCDRTGYDKNLEEREYGNKLLAGEEFYAEYGIKID